MGVRGGRPKTSGCLEKGRTRRGVEEDAVEGIGTISAGSGGRRREVVGDDGVLSRSGAGRKRIGEGEDRREGGGDSLWVGKVEGSEGRRDGRHVIARRVTRRRKSREFKMKRREMVRDDVLKCEAV